MRFQNIHVLFGSVAALVTPVATLAQPFQPTAMVEVETNQLDVLVGDDFNPESWTLNADYDPDPYSVRVEPDEPKRICLISRTESVCRMVGIGDVHDFVLRHEGIDYNTRFVGLPPQVTFDAAYREKYRGRLTVDHSRAYELVNIAIALTQTARDDTNLVYQKSDYYADMLAHFAPVTDHPFVLWLNEELEKNKASYSSLKMNGYAFVLDDAGDIQRSPIYDSASFPGSLNLLAPHIETLRSFARQSNYAPFMDKHAQLYADQAEYFRSEADAAAMLDWLGKNFPDVTPYDHTKIVFSPLVYGWQSVTRLSDDDFRELQPHINFPYPFEPKGELTGVSDAGRDLVRGSLLFTELNHGFINPTADPFASRISAVIEDLDRWGGKNAKGYNSPQSMFNEMLNWGLISLYALDNATSEDAAKIIANNQRIMVDSRTFKQFAPFNAFLVELYRNRPAGATLASLYPEIVAWFERHARTLETKESASEQS